MTVAAPEWTPRMTPDQVTGLLVVLTSLDTRFTAPDAETAAVRARVWWKIMGEVDPAYAMRYVERAYSEARNYALQAADILASWRADVAAAHSAEDAERDRAEGLWQSTSDRQAETLDALRAIAAGATVDQVVPETGRRLTESAETWIRRCTYHRICACSHRTCWDGWEDEDVVTTDDLGREHRAVRRCVACADAVLMATEQGIAKKPSGGRRR